MCCKWNSRRQTLDIPDPSFGQFGVKYQRSALTDSWEKFMDGLNLPQNSAIRGHIRQLFARPGLDEQLQELFDALSGGADRLDRSDMQRFSCGIQGHLHVLLKTSSRVPLVEPTAEDGRWIAEEFDKVFPMERPLDRPTFPALAKLVLLRRVVRTLMESVGLEQLQGGVSQPLVIEVLVELGAGREPFRLHTVTPSSVPSFSCGERISLIQEADDEEVSGKASEAG